MHAPAIFVCSLVWPPDLAQLPPGVSASEHSPARAATPCSPAVKAPQRADQARDEVRERVLLLLQGLEPVLDVQAVGAFVWGDTQWQSADCQNGISIDHTDTFLYQTTLNSGAVFFTGHNTGAR